MKKIDINDFSGGINIRFAPEDFKANENFEITGLMLTNEQSLRTQPPLQAIGHEISGSSVPTPNFRWIRSLISSDGTSYIIGRADGGEIYYMVAPGTDAVYINTKTATWTRIQATNGSPTLQVVLGQHSITNFAFTTPFAPIQTVPALLINSAWNVGVSVDEPVIIYVLPGDIPRAWRVRDGAGLPAVYPGYLPTNPQNVTSTFATGNVTVTWTAPDNPGSSAVNNYYVYDKNGTLKATIAAPTLTATYAGVSGDEVGVRVRAGNSYGITPFDVGGNVRTPAIGYIPRANVGVFWNGYLVLGDIEYYRDTGDISKNIPLSSANSTRLRNGIWFSTPDNPTQFNPLAQFIIGQPDSQIIQMVVIPAGLLIFTSTVGAETGIFLLRGTSPGVVTEDELILNFSLELVRGGLGVPQNRSPNFIINKATSWGATGTVVFLDENNLIYQTDGQNVKLISDNILNVQTQKFELRDNLVAWDKYILAGLNNRLYIGRDYGETISWTSFVLPTSTVDPRFNFNGPGSMIELNNCIYFTFNGGIGNKVWRFNMSAPLQSNAFFEYGKIDGVLADLILTTRPVRDTDMHEKTFWHSVGLRFRPQLFAPFGPTPPSSNTNNFKIKEYKCGISPITTFGFTPLDTYVEQVFSPPLEYPFSDSSTSRGEKKFKAHGPSLEAQARFVFQGHADIEGITFYGHGRKPVNQ
jgi:hypothetical protein